MMYVGHKKLSPYAFSDHFLEEFQKEKQSFDHYDFLDYFEGNVKSAPWGLIFWLHISVQSFFKQF